MYPEHPDHQDHFDGYHFHILYFVISALVFAMGIGSIFVEKEVYARIYDQGPERVYDEEFAKYFSQDSFYVQLTPSTSENVLQELKANGIILSYAQPFTTLDIPYYRLQFKTSNQEKIQTILNIMKKNNQIDYTEPVPIYTIQQTDSSASSISIDDQWYLGQIGLIREQVACLISDHPKPRIAVIDNAFVSDHPNIVGQITKMIDVADSDDDVTPPDIGEHWGHGTMSIGLIAGIPRHGQGILGTSLDNADIIAIKATQDTADPTQITHGIEGLQAAIDAGADIVVMSRGSPQDSKVFRQVIDKAKAKGIQVIAAAGNQGEAKPFFPATYPEVIAVGSYDHAGKQAFFSNHGSRVDIYAPGTDLVVPTVNNGYTISEGTSLSAPIYAGVYALLTRYFGKADYVPFFLQNRTSLIDGKPTLQVYSLCTVPEIPNEHTAAPEFLLPEQEEVIVKPEPKPVEEPLQPTGFVTQSSVHIYPAVLPTDLFATRENNNDYERKLRAVLTILSGIALLLRMIEPHVHDEYRK